MKGIAIILNGKKAEMTNKDEEYFNNSTIKIQKDKIFKDITSGLSSLDRDEFKMRSIKFIRNAKSKNDEDSLIAIVSNIDYLWKDNLERYISEEIALLPEEKQYAYIKFGKEDSSNTVIVHQQALIKSIENKDIYNVEMNEDKTEIVNIRGNKSGSLGVSDLQNKVIVLIDDISGTGKTLNDVCKLFEGFEIIILCYFMTQDAIKLFKENESVTDVHYSKKVVSYLEKDLGKCSASAKDYIRNKEGKFKVSKKNFSQNLMVSLDFKSPNNNLNLLYKNKDDWSSFLYRFESKQSKDSLMRRRSKYNINRRNPQIKKIEDRYAIKKNRNFYDELIDMYFHCDGNMKFIERHYNKIDACFLNEIIELLTNQNKPYIKYKNDVKEGSVRK